MLETLENTQKKAAQEQSCLTVALYKTSQRNCEGCQEMVDEQERASSAIDTYGFRNLDKQLRR